MNVNDSFSHGLGGDTLAEYYFNKVKQKTKEDYFPPLNSEDLIGGGGNVEEEEEIIEIPDVDEDGIVLVVNIANISNKKIIWGGTYGSSGEFPSTAIASVEIDEIDTITSPDKTNRAYLYQFTTSGEHTLKYTLSDPTTITQDAFGMIFGGEDQVIKSITIPSSISTGAKYLPRATERLIVSKSNTIYDSRNNCNAIIETASNILIGGCNVSKIPDSVTSIDDHAFASCTALTSTTVPNSVTSIGSYAFSYCSALTSVTIGDSVTTIGDNAFYSCTSLTGITVLATTPPTLIGVGPSGNYYFQFNDTNNCPIYVPASSIDTYKAATGWSTYASRIQAIA